MRATLDALADDAVRRSHVLRAVPADLVDRIQRLAAGVEVDLDPPLAPELDDAGMP